MKTCPICKARCFADMEVCYGCMHRFGAAGNTVAIPVIEDTPAPIVPEKTAEDPSPRARNPRHAHTARPADVLGTGSVRMAEGSYEIVISLRPS